MGRFPLLCVRRFYWKNELVIEVFQQCDGLSEPTNIPTHQSNKQRSVQHSALNGAGCFVGNEKKVKKPVILAAVQ